MSLESRATFRERVLTLGLEEFLPRFETLGWLTYGELAFATSFVPGTSDDDRFVTDVGIKILTGSAEDVRANTNLPRVRRLFYEAYALAAADLKRRVEGHADDGPRKVAPAEREERRAATAKRLVGVRLENEADISDRLLDHAIQM